MNGAPRSETIDVGTSCREDTSYGRCESTPFIMSVSSMEKKCEDLLKRSIITQMVSYPLGVLSGLIMESMEMCSISLSEFFQLL